MTATQLEKRPGQTPEESESALEEVIETALYPDRAHHDELGRSEEPAEYHEASPREQAAGPIDVHDVDE